MHFFRRRRRSRRAAATSTREREILDRLRPLLLSSPTARVTVDTKLKLNHPLTSYRRARDGALLLYRVEILIDPVFGGVPVHDPDAKPGWSSTSAFVTLLDEDLQIPSYAECDDDGMLDRVIAEARAIQIKRWPQVPITADLEVQWCRELRHVSTGRTLGYSASVSVQSEDPRAPVPMPISVFLDPDGALPTLERAELF